MKLNELFKRLSYGELSNLSIGKEGAGEIVEESHNKIVGYTNTALLRLFTRFMLRENDLFLVLSMNNTRYSFDKRFAHSQTSPNSTTPRYIFDSAERPYEDDLLKVLSVWNSSSVELPLNDIGNRFSVFTPEPNLLQVPHTLLGEIVTVVYQARHPILNEGDLEQEINIPVVLEEALTAFIAHRVFSDMNGQDNAIKASEHLLRFETICAEIVDKDLVNSSSYTSTFKLHERGFA